MTASAPVPSYRRVNQAFWDERAAAHVASPDYNLARFREDAAFISEGTDS